MDIFVADKQLNKIMDMVDLRLPHKWYYSLIKVTFTTSTEITNNYFYKIIEESKKENDIWIPAVLFCGNLYVDDEVKELSDGQKSFFVN
jgi:hypothetical protein